MERLIIQEVIQFSACREIYRDGSMSGINAPLLWQWSKQLREVVGKVALRPQGPCAMAEVT